MFNKHPRLIATCLVIVAAIAEIATIISDVHRPLLTAVQTVPVIVLLLSVPLIADTYSRIRRLDRILPSEVKKIRKNMEDTRKESHKSSSVPRTKAIPVKPSPEVAARPNNSHDSTSSNKQHQKFIERKRISSSPRRDLTVMTIADEFSIQAFSDEWKQLLPTPENCMQMLSEHKPDLLFIESAWNGNGGTWKYHLTGRSAPRQSIRDLITACKDRGIPTLLWAKEDPPHFHDFLPLARLVDHVFTTEESLITLYQRYLGHDRVSLLPFAAQERLHNPSMSRGTSRDLPCVFGGMYFSNKYPERAEQMNFLLPAAGKMGLDIYSRHFGGDAQYQFPAFEGAQVYRLFTNEGVVG